MLQKKNQLTRKQIASFAKAQELELLGIVRLEKETLEFDHFEKWLAAGKNAEMKFLEKNKALRQLPHTLIPNAKTAVILGLPYFQGHNSQKTKNPDRRFQV